jgi:N4-(beta-N-acetylglucosaminyl)-L-asparaginase
MSMGYSPELACKKAIEKIVGINPAKSRDFQVGFIAINKQGEYGAYSIQPGFSYAVTDMQNPQGIVLQSQSYYS